MPLKDMYEPCGQCKFEYARVDTEAWGKNSARRLMCPVCGWTAYEEIVWNESQPNLVKRNEAKGFGAFRLIPPGGYCGYNAFHEQPSPEVLHSLRDLMVNKGWKGYISVWDEAAGKPFLLQGSPLDKFAVIDKR